MFSMNQLSKTAEYKNSVKLASQYEAQLSQFNRQNNYISADKDTRSNLADGGGAIVSTALAFTGVGGWVALGAGLVYSTGSKIFISHRARHMQDITDTKKSQVMQQYEQATQQWTDFALTKAEEGMPKLSDSLESHYSYSRELYNLPTSVKLQDNDKYNRLHHENDQMIQQKIAGMTEVRHVQRHQETASKLDEINQQEHQVLDMLKKSSAQQEINTESLGKIQISQTMLNQRIDELTILMPELHANTKREIAQLSEEMFTKTTAELRQIKTMLQRGEQRAQAKARQQHQAAIIQKQLSDYDGAGQAYAFTAQLGKALGSKQLVQIGVVGESLMKICAARTVLSTGMATGFAALGPIGIIGSAGLTIFQVFGPGGDDPNKILMEMIQQVSLQIDDLHKDMQENFQETFERFDALFRFCLEGFEKITHLLENSVIPRLDQVQTTLDSIADYLERVELDHRLGAINRDINMIAGRDLKTLDIASYDNYLRTLTYHATATAIEKYANNSSADMAKQDPKKMIRLLSLLASTNNPVLVAANIDLLRDLTPFARTSLAIPNPLIWAAVADHYVNLVNAQVDPLNGPNFDSNQSAIEQIQVMMEIGQRYQSFILTMRENALHLLQQQYISYYEALDNIARHIETKENAYNQELQIHNPRVRQAKPVKGITLRTNIVDFANKHYHGHAGLEKVQYHFTKAPHSAHGEHGNRYTGRPKPTTKEIIAAACKTSPQLANPLLNLGVAMGLGSYHFDFYTDVTNNGGQRWSSKVGPNKEKNGLTTIYKFTSGPNYKLSQGQPYVIWWRSCENEKHIEEQHRLKARILYSVTNKGSNNGMGEPHTKYTPLTPAQERHVANILDTELLQKRSRFKKEIQEDLNLDLLFEAKYQRELLIVLLKTMGVSTAITHSIRQQLTELEDLVQLFKRFDPQSRTLPDYKELLRPKTLGAIRAIENPDNIEEVTYLLQQESPTSSAYLKTYSLLTRELDHGLVATPEMNNINLQLERLISLEQQLSSMPYCESNDESDAIELVNKQLAQDIIRRSQWQYSKNQITGQIENIALRKEDKIYPGMLRTDTIKPHEARAEHSQVAQAVILRSISLPEERRTSDIKNILNAAETWKKLGLLHGVTQHVSKSDNSKREITFVTQKPFSNLETYLNNIFQAGKLLNKKQQLLLILHITLNLRELHARDLVHGNLEPKNILLFNPIQDGEQDYYASRISDIEQIDDEPTANEKPYAEMTKAQYQAPEITAGESAQKASDIFSLSIIIWRILQQGQPCAALTEAQLPLSELNDAFPFLVKIMQSCHQDNPQNRPNVTEVINSILQWPKQNIREISDRYYPGFFAASTANNPLPEQDNQCTIM